MKPATIIAIATAASLAGCATYRPVVDMKGVDPASYEADLAECQRYATERDPASQAVAGAVIGALFGALVGAATGTSRNYGASVGAVSGVGAGAAHGIDSQINIVRRCMAGRGYQVLN